MTREEKTIQMEKIAVENRQLRDSIKHLALELEEKNRELAIEAALDRVQAKSMAMHSSKDISGAIVVVFKELRKLGIDFERCGVAFFNDTPIIEVWSTPLSPNDDENVEVVVGHLDATIHPNLQGAHSAWSDKKDYYTYELVGEEVKKYYELLEKVPDYRFPKIKKYPERQISNNFFFNEGQIFFYQREPLSEETKRILTRFTHVFSRTYRRYLDIVRAETQAREATIEAALERVRSAAMAMHSSKDLFSVADLLRDELSHLGKKDLESSIIHLYRENSPNFDVWYSYRPLKDPTGALVQDHISVPKDASSWTIEMIGKYHSQHETYTIESKGKMLEEWYHVLEKYAPATVQYDSTGKMILPEVLYYHFSKFLGGALLMVSDAAPDAEACTLQLRAAKVFELAYTRFKDLQKAEEQTRESQIELAMERVRARTMAMQKSDELTDVAGILFNQISKLGIKAWTTGFNVWSDDNKYYTDYITNPQGGFVEPYTIEANSFPAFKEVSDARKSGEEFFVSYLEGEMLKETYLQLSKFGDEQQYEKMLEGGFQFPSRQFNHFVFGSKVSLMIITYEPVPEAHDIFKRFGKVFEQTYTRFLDLQKAEAQAREAIKQTSLDRVRGEIASMRSTDDLQRITPLVWHELTVLGVPFFRCGVFIVDEIQQTVHLYLSTPDGHPLGVLDLPFGINDTTLKVVEHWRKNAVYQAFWNREQFVAWMQSLVEQYRLPSETAYLGAETPPESLYLNFIPFKQGMLYVGNTHELPTAEIDLVQNLASAFSMAYARYEDFKELEEAKARVEATLDKLKATQAQLIQSEKMASLGELTAGIAHEIQNPLNFVNNYAEVNVELIDELTEEITAGHMDEAKDIIRDLRDNESKIHHHGQRADAIVRGMLQHSRTHSGTREQTNFNALADEYLRLAYHGLRAKDNQFQAEFITDFDKSLPLVEVVPQDMGRVLLNIINNAFQAVHEKSKEGGAGHKPAVTVATRKLGDSVEIRIADNGNGIPDAIQEKIFQPFFTTKPTGQGTGLGLSLAYDTVKAHGGTLRVESKVGEGSVFVITIPVGA